QPFSVFTAGIGRSAAATPVRSSDSRQTVATRRTGASERRPMTTPLLPVLSSPRRKAGCNPIPKSGALTFTLVIPAKAGTRPPQQGFQLLAPGSPLSRGRRIDLSAGFPDSL